MNIDYNLYKIFLYLFEEKSISKTASKLYVSQPAISYSLKELENQLGYTLFNRNSKGIEPTAEAEELYHYVSMAFNILKDGEEQIENINGLNIGNIRLGISNNVPYTYFCNLLTKFKEIYPGLNFQIFSGTTKEIFNMMTTRELDFVIDVYETNIDSSILKKELGSFNSSFVYNEKLLGKIDVNNLEDLNKYNLILPVEKTNSRAKLNEYLRNRNVELKPSFEMSDIRIIYESISDGLGVGYIPEVIIQDKNLKVLEFSDLPNVEVGLFYQDSFLKVAAKKFIKFLIDNK